MHRWDGPRACPKYFPGIGQERRSYWKLSCSSPVKLTVLAAVLPGTGKDPLVRLAKTADADGVYPLILPGLDGGEVVGHFQLFDEAAVDAMNVATHLLQVPESLAYLLEAAGAVALERAGAILESRV